MHEGKEERKKERKKEEQQNQNLMFNFLKCEKD